MSRQAVQTFNVPQTVLGIETSCDETAAAVVRLSGDGEVKVASSVVLSQIARHAPYGGVVPEIAARAHVESIDVIVARALADARIRAADLDGIAATAGPGLVGGVMVGLSFGKAMALALDKPLVAVNHLEGHAVSARLTTDIPYPFLLLLVSGGHCQLLDVVGIGACRRLGSTIDDAAGEAFDKIGGALGLAYPAGPALERLAEGGDASRFPLPRALLGRAGCDFSFSGLKTAAARLAHGLAADEDRRDLASAVQAAIARPTHRANGAGDDGLSQYPRRPRPAAGGSGRRRRQRRGEDGFADSGGGARLRVQRAAAGILHGQRRHDRSGRRGAARRRDDRRPRCGSPPSLAAGRGRRPFVADPRRWTQGRQGVKRAGIIGGGAWGTALSQVCARAGLETILWAREAAVVEAINGAHSNPLFLPGVDIDAGIRATLDPAELAGADFILAVAPAQHLRSSLMAFEPNARAGLPIVLCAKGVEQGSLKLMAQVLAEVLPDAAPAVLSGPSFAGEVARGLPTAITLAAPDLALARAIARAIATAAFRPYVTDDIIGAEAGGAVKNVLAIACGIVEGRELGRSAHAALITRGFAELTRLAVALGGEAETVAGLCGLGDLVLTCSSPQSRNMSVGLALGRGESLEAALAGKISVAEGVASAPAVVGLAARLGVEVPICAAVHAILSGAAQVDPVIAALLSRPLKEES